MRLLRFAKELGGKLVVGVFSDKISGIAAHIFEGLRLKNIESITWVDQAFIIEEDIVDVIDKIKPSIIVKGKEFENRYNLELDTVSDGSEIRYGWSGPNICLTNPHQCDSFGGKYKSDRFVLTLMYYGTIRTRL